MKEAMDETRILSTLEVKICMQILGVEEWNYFPISLEEENLDQRIMEAFLRLVEMGFLESCDGGYRKTEQMEQIFAQAVHPDFTMQVLKKESMPMVVSGNRKKMVVLETLSVQDKNSIVYGYDHVGRVTEKRIAENNRIQYEYNPFGEVKKIQHLDERGVLDSFEFGYDKLGRKSEYGVYRRDYSKDNGRYAYLYDPAGHLKQVYKNNELIREYFYDSLGNRSKMLEYDPVEKTSAETEYLYDPAGTLKQVKKGEYQEEYRYDKRGNLIRQIIDIEAFEKNFSTFPELNVQGREKLHREKLKWECRCGFQHSWDEIECRNCKTSRNNARKAYYS